MSPVGFLQRVQQTFILDPSLGLIGQLWLAWSLCGLASPCPFPAPWSVGSSTVTNSSYSDKGESRGYFMAEFLSPEILFCLRGTIVPLRLTAPSSGSDASTAEGPEQLETLFLSEA